MMLLCAFVGDRAAVWIQLGLVQMKLRLFREMLLIVAPFLALSEVVAQEIAQWDLEVSENVSYVLNANRAALTSDQIDEGQITSSLLLGGALARPGGLSSSLKYQIAQTEYLEDTQESDPRLTGDTLFSYGGARDFYTASVFHQRRQLLKDPGTANIDENQDDRDTFGASLTLRTNPINANSLQLLLQHQAIRFDEFYLNDTDRQAVELQWSRRMTELNSVGATISATQVAYANYAGGDYDLNVYYGFFQRRLRTMHYYLALGVNDVKSSRSNSTSPYVQLTLSKRFGAPLVNFGLSSVVLDDSSVNRSEGDDPVFTDVDDLNDITGGRLSTSDQFQRVSAYAEMVNPALCRGCSVRIRLEMSDDKYDNLPEEDLITTRLRVGIAYDYSRKGTLGFEARHADLAYSNGDGLDDFLESDVSLSLTRNLSRRFWGAVKLRSTERNFDGSGSYTTQSVGIELRYIGF